MGTDKGQILYLFEEMTLSGVCTDWSLLTVVFLPPGVTPDASYLASVIRRRTNIG